MAVCILHYFDTWLLVTLVVLLAISEPVRTETLKTEKTNLSIAFMFRYMREQLNIYLPVYLALSLSTLVGYAYFILGANFVCKNFWLEHARDRLCFWLDRFNRWPMGSHLMRLAY